MTERDSLRLFGEMFQFLSFRVILIVIHVILPLFHEKKKESVKHLGPGVFPASGKKRVGNRPGRNYSSRAPPPDLLASCDIDSTLASQRMLDEEVSAALLLQISDDNDNNEENYDIDERIDEEPVDDVPMRSEDVLNKPPAVVPVVSEDESTKPTADVSVEETAEVPPEQVDKHVLAKKRRRILQDCVPAKYSRLMKQDCEKWKEYYCIVETNPSLLEEKSKPPKVGQPAIFTLDPNILISDLQGMATSSDWVEGEPVPVPRRIQKALCYGNPEDFW